MLVGGPFDGEIVQTYPCRYVVMAHSTHYVLYEYRYDVVDEFEGVLLAEHNSFEDRQRLVR